MIAWMVVALLQTAPAASAPVSAPVTVSAHAAKTDVGVGEGFALEITATGPAGTTWMFPDALETETIALRPVLAAPGSASPPPSGTMRYEAAVFTLDEPQVPALAVKYRLPDGREGVVQTAPVPLKIATVLPRDPKEQTLADLRPPQALGIGRAFWIALGAGAGVLAALAFWLWRRRRPRAAPAAVVPVMEADVEALAAIDRLEGAGLLGRGDWRAFYIELAAIAKRYLERRLGAPILEMTTAEMLAVLREHRFGAEALPLVRDLAGAADRVKFARGAGLMEEAQRHLLGARTLVQSIEARLKAEAAAAAAAERAPARKTA